MALYLVLFLVDYPVVVKLSTGLPRSKAVVTGVAGFIVFQGFELIFIR